MVRTMSTTFLRNKFTAKNVSQFFVNNNEGEAKMAYLIILIETLWSTKNYFEEIAWSF